MSELPAEVREGLERFRDSDYREGKEIDAFTAGYRALAKEHYPVKAS